VRPGDNACDAYPDLDFAELLYEVEDESGIKIPIEDMKKMEATFDAVVRYFASHQRSPS
jgi:acyl carrier protein